MNAISRDSNTIPTFKSNPAAGLIKDTLEDLEISQSEAARAMKIPRSRLSDMFAGRKGVSSDTALRCDRYLGISARILIELQARYDLSLAYHKNADQISKEVSSFMKEAS